MSEPLTQFVQLCDSFKCASVPTAAGVRAIVTEMLDGRAELLQAMHEERGSMSANLASVCEIHDLPGFDWYAFRGWVGGDGCVYTRAGIDGRTLAQQYGIDWTARETIDALIRMIEHADGFAGVVGEGPKFCAREAQWLWPIGGGHDAFGRMRAECVIAAARKVLA